MQGIDVSIFNALHWVGITLDLAFDVREATTRLLPYATKRECNQHKSKLFVFGLLVGYIFSATGVDSTGCSHRARANGFPLYLAAKAKRC